MAFIWIDKCDCGDEQAGMSLVGAHDGTTVNHVECAECREARERKERAEDYVNRRGWEVA